MANEYMPELILAVKNKVKEDVRLCAAIIGTMAGSKEAKNVFGTTEKAFKAATKYVKECNTFKEALDKFEKDIVGE